MRILVAILTTALAAGSAAAARTPTPTRTPLPATPTRTPQAQAAAGSVLRVPADVADLQAAITRSPPVASSSLAAGTYTPPANGFAINDTGRAFTIRAASGATVVLDGGGSRDLVRLINSSVGAGRPVVFESLVFRNGRSTSEGIAGGVTVQRGQVTFRGCTFDSNRSDRRRPPAPAVSRSPSARPPSSSTARGPATSPRTTAPAWRWRTTPPPTSTTARS
ncbi:MAG: hypothetical protein U0802_14790 [Candidatus Binatia bacterium]